MRFVRRLGILQLKDSDPVTVVAFSTVLHFFVISAFYFSSPVRDEVSAEVGQGELPALFYATMLATLFVNPVFSAFVHRFPLSRLVPWTYRAFALIMLAFFLATRHTTIQESRTLAYGFYTWMGVFALFNSSLFWSLVTDTFDDESGGRLFGLISAVCVSRLVPYLGSAPMLLISACCLEACAQLVRQIQKARHAWAGTSSTDRLATGAHTAHPERERPGLWAVLTHGARLVTSSPFLIAIATYIFLNKMSASVLYFVFVAIWSESIDSAEDRVRFVADINSLVGLMTLAFQVFGTGWFISRLGTGMGLCLVPITCTLGMAYLLSSPTLFAVASFRLLRNALNFAIARPSKELLFTAVDTQKRYIAKNLIDVFITRAGDATAAWFFSEIISGEDIKIGNDEFSQLVRLGVIVGAIWLVVAIALARMYEKERKPDHVNVV